MTRIGTLPCELVDFSDFLIDCPFKFEGVEGFNEILESLLCFFFDVFGFQDSLVRRLGFIVTSDGFGSDSFFGQEFDGRDEEVVVEAPLVFVKVRSSWERSWDLRSAGTRAIDGRGSSFFLRRGRCRFSGILWSE